MNEYKFLLEEIDIVGVDSAIQPFEAIYELLLSNGHDFISANKWLRRYTFSDLDFAVVVLCPDKSDYGWTGDSQVLIKLVGSDYSYALVSVH